MPKGIPGRKRRRRGPQLTRTSIAGNANNLAMLQALNQVNAGVAQLNALCTQWNAAGIGTTRAYGRGGRQAANVIT